jgi:hypothetical protein
MYLTTATAVAYRVSRTPLATSKRKRANIAGLGCARASSGVEQNVLIIRLVSLDANGSGEMNLALLGGFGQRWHRQIALTLLGRGQVDLTTLAPGDNPRVTAIAIFGGMDVLVEEGTNVNMTGFSVIGGREEMEIAAGPGPAVRIRAIAVFGGVKVRTP